MASYGLSESGLERADYGRLTRCWGDVVPDRRRRRGARLDDSLPQYGGEGGRRDSFGLREEVHPGGSGELENPLVDLGGYAGLREKGMLRLEGRSILSRMATCW